jgi:hypothetical protein
MARRLHNGAANMLTINHSDLCNIIGGAGACAPATSSTAKPAQESVLNPPKILPGQGEEWLPNEDKNFKILNPMSPTDGHWKIFGTPRAGA